MSRAYTFEKTNCTLCHSGEAVAFLTGQDDLTGKPGDFSFVKCRACGFVYQNPRIVVNEIVDFYDDNYIAHRQRKSWGVLTPFYNWVMGKMDRDKLKIVTRVLRLGRESRVLDVGCAVGTFLLHLREKLGVQISGVDFKKFEHYPGFETIDFHQGLFYEQRFDEKSFDLVTMWHFLEHDYDPRRSLQTARRVLKDEGLLVIEVPRLDSLTFFLYGKRWPGVQAPQHTGLYDKKHLREIVESEGFEIVEHLSYGAFPSYFYLFMGFLFLFRNGKGVNLREWAIPYVMGQLVLSPVLLFEKFLNLSMQTVLCRKRSE